MLINIVILAQIFNVKCKTLTLIIKSSSLQSTSKLSLLVVSHVELIYLNKRLQVKS